MPGYIEVSSFYIDLSLQIEKGKQHTPIITNANLHSERRRVAKALIKYFTPTLIPHHTYRMLSERVKIELENILPLPNPKDEPSLLCEKMYKFKASASLPYIKVIDGYLLLENLFSSFSPNDDPATFLGDRSVIELDE